MIAVTSRWTTGVARRVLPNGLTALVQSDPDAPAVALVTHVKAGFFDEPDHWAGISHVLEHMFFKGTPTRGVGQVASETKALGGYLNASTSYDATSYYVVLPAGGFERALEIQADALRNTSVDGAELARELKVIIEEAKRKLDTPSAVVHETLHAVLFDRHRIRRWRIGTEDQLARYTRDDVLGYYRSRYVPERVIVSIVGAVETETAFQAVERLYGDWPRAPGAVDPSPAEPLRVGARAKTLRGDVRQAELALGWRGTAPLEADAAALDLAAVILSAGRGSWLYQSLRQSGLVTSIGAYHYSPSEIGVFSIGADLAPADMPRATAGIAAEVARLRSAGPGAADLERAKTLLTAQWARRLESVEGRASAFAAAESLGGLAVLEDEYERLLAVSSLDVRRVAERYLAPELMSGVVYLPETEGGDLVADELERGFAAATPAPAKNGRAPARRQPEPRSVRARERPGGVVHVALPGVDLLLRPKRGVPMVTVGVARRRAGPETDTTAGLGALTIRAAARGAGELDGPALADGFEALGGTLGTSIGADWFGFSTSVLAEHLAPAAGLLADVLMAPRLASEEIERERGTLIDEAEQVADDMFRYPVQLALEAAFGPSGYGLPVKGTVESLRSLAPDDARRWHGAELAEGRTAVVAVGAIDAERAAELLAGVFGDLGARPVSPPTEVAPWSRVVPALEQTRVKSQTAFAMAFPGPARTIEDRFAAEVLAAVASGLGGRLFQALRDRRSLAYSVVVSSWQRARAGAILTYIGTSPEREAEAREAMLEELAALGSSGPTAVTDDEVSRAVSYLAGQSLVQRQTNASVASEILDAWLVGTGLDELTDPAAGYRQVTREAVAAVAAACLRPELRVEGVVRGARGGGTSAG